MIGQVVISGLLAGALRRIRGHARLDTSFDERLSPRRAFELAGAKLPIMTKFATRFAEEKAS